MAEKKNNRKNNMMKIIIQNLEEWEKKFALYVQIKT